MPTRRNPDESKGFVSSNSYKKENESRLLAEAKLRLWGRFAEEYQKQPVSFALLPDLEFAYLSARDGLREPYESLAHSTGLEKEAPNEAGPKKATESTPIEIGGTKWNQCSDAAHGLFVETPEACGVRDANRLRAQYYESIAFDCKDGTQRCHECPELTCGDNMSPASRLKRIEEHRDRLQTFFDAFTNVRTGTNAVNWGDVRRMHADMCSEDIRRNLLPAEFDFRYEPDFPPTGPKRIVYVPTKPLIHLLEHGGREGFSKLHVNLSPLPGGTALEILLIKPEDTFRCTGCGLVWPSTHGAGDEHPDLCDPCANHAVAESKLGEVSEALWAIERKAKDLGWVEASGEGGLIGWMEAKQRLAEALRQRDATLTALEQDALKLGWDMPRHGPLGMWMHHQADELRFHKNRPIK